ncbi:MAG: hypothetical protein HRT47_00200 [Candidatus Caenarcaniphilales bacterium]|nr:hypothetical protein [Candidatus Caenarcaniphilales bacterium]
MSFENTKSLYVTLKHYDKNYEVGRLALKDLDIYFEYNPDFLKTKIEISPLKLALKTGINKGDRKIICWLVWCFQ